MTPRLRVIAGPNGSGKTTLAEQLTTDYSVNLYRFLNSDVLNAEIRLQHKTACPFSIEPQALTDFAAISTYPAEYKQPFLDGGIAIGNDDYVYFKPDSINSYTSAILADFFKEQHLIRKVSFSFETVFSHPAKIDILRRAQQSEYRTYLYFVATENPDINISRIAARERSGGHGVPEDKIRSRYKRCLEQIKTALPYLNRAFFFDNTLADLKFFAEYNGESGFTFYSEIPRWFQQHVL